MTKYIVKGTDILYNGKLFAEGSEIEVKDDEAKQLADYLEKIPEPKKETKKQEKIQKEPEKSPIEAKEPNGGDK